MERLLTLYGLQMEMANKSHIIAMTSFLDTDEAFERLTYALREIDKSLKILDKPSLFKYPKINIHLTLCEADTASKQKLNIDKAVGKISGDFVYIYPPGVPILAPGEIVTEEIISLIKDYIKEDFFVSGLYENKNISCIM